MHLRSVSIKGFKSFPDRTKLEFSPGVSVIVGPNGSGKSNITEAVLWALGEQSPLAVRGQTMQDVIFAGGHGVPSRSAAEVEVILADADVAGPGGFNELSIVRRLDRAGDGEYRLNGAKCRLVDVLEAMSDTGLGKEMHSVVSQGKVESIIHSRPRERRLLIEEAAGLGKHRKRRRRAELKLRRTEENLSRALDVEREARSRLKPLKRQAEAAELHARLERGVLEARLELAREAARAAGVEVEAAEAGAAGARAGRDEADGLMAAVAARREAAEQAFAAHSAARERFQALLYSVRSAEDRIALRAERARDAERAAAEGVGRRTAQLGLLEDAIRAEAAAPAERASQKRIAELEAELAALGRAQEEQLAADLGDLEAELTDAAARRGALAGAAEERRAELRAAEAAAERARSGRREAERAAESARARAAAVGAELAAVNGFLRAAAAGPAGVRTLAEGIRVEPGYELALAAALGPRLRAAVASDLVEAGGVLDRAGADGGVALLSAWGADDRRGAAAAPAPGAEPLLDRVAPRAELAPLAARLLHDVWVVEALDALPAGFRGIAVTCAGRVLDGRSGELRQTAAGGEERVLEQGRRRDELVAATEHAAGAEAEARRAAEAARDAVSAADAAREEADARLRAARRQHEEAAEAVRRIEAAIARRRAAPAEGPAAARRAGLEAELRAERRIAEQAERERAERADRADRLRARIEREEALRERAERVAHALLIAGGAVASRREALAARFAADEAVGERTAAELRSCAREEADIQTRLRAAAEAVTAAEVRAQRARDIAADASDELAEVAGRLGLDGEAAAPAAEPLDETRREELRARLERLARRREALGPVNPLAAEEYEQAVAHVDELEEQRRDLEGALGELEKLIRDTDRRIREQFDETFEAAAHNFEELVGELFPGGRGRLRLVRPDGPRPVLGGEQAAADEDAAPAFATAPATEAAAPGADSAASHAALADQDEEAPEADEPGVEVEVTPAGKATKRLSLLSGGEKSLVALAFLFAVFLARPCPFYVLDEVEAALDDPNIDRFLRLVRRYADRAQFIVVTHQKRTMDAADRLYGVSMGRDGVSKVVSRRLGGAPESEQAAPDAPAAVEAA